MLGAALACRAPDTDSDTAASDPTLPDGPTLVDTPLTDAPSYLFLFTHTEDQFNHLPSEARYTRVGQMLEELAVSDPGVPIVWTIEFQGSDAATVLARNPQTGVADYLMELHDDGLVAFGYHAHHDPTYNSRPQNDLPPEPTYQEVYDALWTWITCEKNPTVGGCVAARGGGLEAVLEGFGEVRIVSGLGVGEGLQVERSAGSQAVHALLSERGLRFGFPDHGAVLTDPEYVAARDGLLALMTPTHETSSGTLWIDNAVAINDAASLEGVSVGPLREGPDLALKPALEALDGTRSFVLNLGIADKFLYTDPSTSPTRYGYAHPSAPELPPELLLPPSEREKRYQWTRDSLEHLVTAISGGANLQFVSPEQVVDLFTSDDYFDVDADELEAAALWTLEHWDGRPPAWSYDGEDFYSLADTFGLLARALGGFSGNERVVSAVYGPWSASPSEAAATTVTVDELRALLEEELISGGRIQESYTVGAQSLGATQVLYALATLYAYDRNTVDTSVIDIPATTNWPASAAFLDTVGCIGCLDTAWSLKPARFQDR